MKIQKPQEATSMEVTGKFSDDPAGSKRSVSTVWALGVPVELRPMVEAAAPECTFHFISIHKSLTEQTNRIVNAPGSFIASWGGAGPSDLAEVVEKTGLPAGRIGLAGLFMQSHPGLAAIQPCGIFLEESHPSQL